jgi:hypothetical protein
MAWETKAFMTLWFAGVALSGAGFIAQLASEYARGEIGGHELLWVLHPIGMLVFGYLLVASGKFLSRNEARDISEWLRNQFVDVALESS